MRDTALDACTRPRPRGRSRRRSALGLSKGGALSQWVWCRGGPPPSASRCCAACAGWGAAEPACKPPSQPPSASTVHRTTAETSAARLFTRDCPRLMFATLFSPRVLCLENPLPAGSIVPLQRWQRKEERQFAGLTRRVQCEGYAVRDLAGVRRIQLQTLPGRSCRQAAGMLLGVRRRAR